MSPDEPRHDFLSSQRSYHVVCVRIVYRGQFMGEIYLHRGRDKPNFLEEELYILRLLQPHISNVFHIIHSLTAVKLLEADKKSLDKYGLCLIDSEVNLMSANVAGLEMLNISTIFGSSVLYHLKAIVDDELDRFPDEHRNNCQANKREEYGRTESLPTAGGELVVHIFPVRPAHRRHSRKYLVMMELLNEAQSIAEYRLKFTKRESDIIDGVLQGKSNPHIASALSISENTVKTHLQNIFRKAGVSTRSKLVYLLMLNRG